MEHKRVSKKSWEWGFERWLSLKYKSRDSLKSYMSTVKLFDAQVGLNKLNTETLLNWILHHKDWSAATIARHGFAMKAYALYAGLKIDWERIPSPKPEYKLKALTFEQVQKLFNACRTLEEQLVLKLGYDLALRVGELCNLTWDLINIKTGEVDLARLKKGSHTVIALDPDTLALARKWAKERGTTHGSVFGFSRSTAQEIVKNVGKRVGIPVHPHLLRHSRATHLSDQGWPIQDIRELLGHKLVTTTQRYMKPNSSIITRQKLAAKSPRIKA